MVTKLEKLLEEKIDEHETPKEVSKLEGSVILKIGFFQDLEKGTRFMCMGGFVWAKAHVPIPRKTPTHPLTVTEKGQDIIFK